MTKARVHRPIQLLGIAAFVMWALPAVRSNSRSPRAERAAGAAFLETINQVSTSAVGSASQKLLIPFAVVRRCTQSLGVMGRASRR